MLPQSAPGTDQRQLTYILNLVADTITANTITGFTIRGGTFFSDTLGGFFPVVISPSSVSGLALNSSANFPYPLRWHNTQYSEYDIAAFLTSPDSGTTSELEIFPIVTGTTQAGWRFDILDYNSAGQITGMILYPAYPSLTTGPALYMDERLVGDAAPALYLRYFGGMFSGGLDNTLGTLPLTVFTKAGAPVDGDFVQYGTPKNGTVAVDTTNLRFYARIAGTWRYAALT